MDVLDLNRTQYLEFEKLAAAAFAPVTGFMDEDTFHSVVDHMRLLDGAPFPLPIVLDVDAAVADSVAVGAEIRLRHKGIEVGTLKLDSKFTCDKDKVAKAVYGTNSDAHPGVRFFSGAGDWFLGGQVRMTTAVDSGFGHYGLSPAETRALFKQKGWKTVAGFQTRNIPHRAHEYLQRVALELVDGLFIQPLVGRKKRGDFAPEAILTAYRALIDGFYPSNQVHLDILTTAMRYAGPREAVFHAIIRRNYGCSHFIVGRDHAGVGEFYGKYDAHELTRRFDGELGIEILRLKGPFHCAICDTIATENTCPHETTNPSAVTHISGTDMRAMLAGGRDPEPHLMRWQLIETLRGQPLFIEEDEP